MQHVIVDSKDQSLTSVNVPGAQRVTCVAFSPGLAHYAFLYGNKPYLDGVPQPGLINGLTFIFSPDDQHLAYPAVLSDHGCFIIDGKVVAENLTMVHYAFFSPDSQHIFWGTAGNLQSLGTTDTKMLYADGKPATHYAEPINGAGVNFEFSPDGVLTFIALKDGKLERFRMTPASDTNVGTMLASATVAQDNK